QYSPYFKLAQRRNRAAPVRKTASSIYEMRSNDAHASLGAVIRLTRFTTRSAWPRLCRLELDLACTRDVERREHAPVVGVRAIGHDRAAHAELLFAAKE